MSKISSLSEINEEEACHAVPVLALQIPVAIPHLPENNSIPWHLFLLWSPTAGADKLAGEGGGEGDKAPCTGSCAGGRQRCQFIAPLCDPPRRGQCLRFGLCGTAVCPHLLPRHRAALGTHTSMNYQQRSTRRRDVCAPQRWSRTTPCQQARSRVSLHPPPIPAMSAAVSKS